MEKIVGIWVSIAIFLNLYASLSLQCIIYEMEGNIQ